MLKIIPLLLISLPVFSSILPENNLAIPIGEKNDGLSEEEYNRVIDQFEITYAPVVKKHGAKLTIERLWENPRVNAGTYRRGNEWVIRMYGGYARHPSVTSDGYALVLCHELGHHLGGAPKKYISGNKSWPSTEGQADYFATLKCLRQVFKNDDNIAIVTKLEVPQMISEKCAEPFKEDWEKALCVRTTMAGIAISKISADIRGTEEARVETPDLTVVDSTYGAHPLPQCRLDTYFQGSICEVSSYRSVSNYSNSRGTCHPENGHESGNRPLCWFRP